MEHELLLHDIFADGKRALRTLLLPIDTAKAGELLAFLWQTEMSTVWVMPKTRWSQTLTRSWFQSVESQWTVIVRSTSPGLGRPLSVLLWPKNEQRTNRQLVFAFPEHAGWGWQLADATSLLATASYLERVLAHPVSDGPALLAQQLLSDLTSNSSSTSGKHSSLQEQESRLLSASAIMNERERDLVWMRPLTRVEQRYKYLHHYTHLSYHLEACLHIPLPVGASEYSATGRAYDGNRPGLWRVQAERAGSIFDGKLLPNCLDGEWMNTQQVQCSRDLGYQVQVCEGFFWPQSQEALQPWACALWQAAQRVSVFSPLFKHEQGRTNTTASIALLAALGLTHFSREQPTSGGFRWDWWTHIVGGSRAILFAHLARLVKRGTMPVLLNGDGLWLVSDDPHPLTAAPGLLDAHPWNGYRVGYVVPLLLSREVREIFRAAASPTQAATYLNTLANEASHP